MPEGSWRAGAADAADAGEQDLDAEEAEEDDEEAEQEDVEDPKPMEEGAAEPKPEPREQEEAAKDATPVQAAVGEDAAAATGADEAEKEPRAKKSKKAKEEREEGEDEADGEEPEEEKKNDEEDEDEDEEDENKQGDEVAGGVVEGSRTEAGQSLFEALGSVAASGGAGAGGASQEEATTREAATVAELSREPEAPVPLEATVAKLDGEASAVLRRSRGRWLVVRLSHRARGFLARPLEHYVRLLSIFRLIQSLVEIFPEEVLVLLLEPLLSPLYRCTSAFGSYESSSLPDVQTLEQALNLRSSQRTEYLGQLARTCSEALAAKLQDAGLGSSHAQALAKVRRAVDRQRAERAQRRRLKPVTDPQAAARQKRVKNRKKQAGKKRKRDEMIIEKKGAKGSIRVKKSRSLV